VAWTPDVFGHNSDLTSWTTLISKQFLPEPEMNTPRAGLYIVSIWWDSEFSWTVISKSSFHLKRTNNGQRLLLVPLHVKCDTAIPFKGDVNRSKGIRRCSRSNILVKTVTFFGFRVSCIDLSPEREIRIRDIISQLYVIMSYTSVYIYICTYIIQCSDIYIYIIYIYIYIYLYIYIYISISISISSISISVSISVSIYIYIYLYIYISIYIYIYAPKSDVSTQCRWFIPCPVPRVKWPWIPWSWGWLGYSCEGIYIAMYSSNIWLYSIIYIPYVYIYIIIYIYMIYIYDYLCMSL